MPQSIIFLTARRISPTAARDLVQPRRVPVSVAEIKDMVTNTKRSGSVIKFWDSTFKGRKIEIFETLNQLKTQIEPSSTEFVPEYTATASAAGVDQAGATAIAQYLTRVTTATANQGVRLPVGAAGAVRVVMNATVNNVRVYPATGQFIQNQAGAVLAANAHVDLAPGATLHFSIRPGTTNTWQVAID